MAQGQTHGGKGSAVRPTDKKKYENNYDAIFGKKNKDKEKKQDDNTKKVRYEFIAHPYDCELGTSPNTTLSLVIHDRDITLPEMYETI